MRRQFVFLVCCAFAVACGRHDGVVHADGEDSTAAKSADSGTIEGTVIYLPDAKRPWRYSRYYIADAKSGELAEAVVALRMSGLKKANSKPSTMTSIDQRNYQFQPETVAIRQGDSVTFTNSDQVVHNVRCVGELASFNVNTPVGGQSYTVRFDRAGGIRRPLEVGCTYHSNMHAWVFVFDHPYYTVTQADGRFRFAGVPPGKHELEMVHPAGGLRWRQRIEVKAGEVLRVDIRISPDEKR